MNTEQERAAFEAAYIAAFPFSSGLPYKFARDEKGEYLDNCVLVGWEMYQAGRAALQSQPIPADDWFDMFMELARAVAVANRLFAVSPTTTKQKAAADAAIALQEHARKHPALQSQDREDSGKLQEAARDIFVRASEIEILYGTNKETEGLVMAAIRLAYLVGPSEQSIDHARRIEESQ